MLQLLSPRTTTKTQHSLKKNDTQDFYRRRQWHPTPVLLPGKSHGRRSLQSMGSQRVGHDCATSLSVFTFMHWRRKWQPTPVFLPGESQGRRSLVRCRLWGHTESGTRLKQLSSSSRTFILVWDSGSVAQSCVTLCNPIDCNTPDFPVLHHLLEFAQTHVHWVGSAIQPSHPLSSPSPPAFNLSQHLVLFQWVGSLHQVMKVF